MLLDLIVSFVAMFVTPDAARGLSSTAPAYLDEDSVRQHLAVAVVAGVLTRTKSAMTPEPITDRGACDAIASSIAKGYRASAHHLRGWLDVCGDQPGCALLGFAGRIS